MGLLKSSVYFTPLSTSFIAVSLFDSESRFFAPTHTCCGRRAQGLSRSAVALPWPQAPSFPGRALTGPSTAATLVVVGTTIRGELCHRARSSRHNLVFGR